MVLWCRRPIFLLLFPFWCLASRRTPLVGGGHYLTKFRLQDFLLVRSFHPTPFVSKFKVNVFLSLAHFFSLSGTQTHIWPDYYSRLNTSTTLQQSSVAKQPICNPFNSLIEDGHRRLRNRATISTRNETEKHKMSDTCVRGR